MKGNKVKAMNSNSAADRKESQKANEAILQQYDQATCEVDVFQHEIQSYMILTGKRMIEKES